MMVFKMFSFSFSKQKTGARIKIFSNCAPQSTDRIIQIIGESDKCVETIREIITLVKSVSYISSLPISFPFFLCFLLTLFSRYYFLFYFNMTLFYFIKTIILLYLIKTIILFYFIKTNIFFYSSETITLFYFIKSIILSYFIKAIILLRHHYQNHCLK